MLPAIRSSFVAGVTLIGAGVFAVTPITSTPPDALGSAPDVRLTSLSVPEQPLNPARLFGNIRQQAIGDLQYWADRELGDPAPILRAVLRNQIDRSAYLAQLVGWANLQVSDVAFNAPAVLAKAQAQVQAGQLQEALTTIEQGTVYPLLAAGSSYTQARTWVLAQQLGTAERVLQVLPYAVRGVVNSTGYAADQTLRAGIDAVAGVGEAAASGDPAKVGNAATLGAANILGTVERTVLGPEYYILFDKVDRPQTCFGPPCGYGPQSVVAAAFSARRIITFAVAGYRGWHPAQLRRTEYPLSAPSVAAAAAALTAAPESTTPVAKSVVKSAKKHGLGGGKKRAAAAR